MTVQGAQVYLGESLTSVACTHLHEEAYNCIVLPRSSPPAVQNSYLQLGLIVRVSLLLQFRAKLGGTGLPRRGIMQLLSGGGKLTLRHFELTLSMAAQCMLIPQSACTKEGVMDLLSGVSKLGPAPGRPPCCQDVRGCSAQYRHHADAHALAHSAFGRPQGPAGRAAVGHSSCCC